MMILGPIGILVPWASYERHLACWACATGRLTAAFVRISTLQSLTWLYVAHAGAGILYVPQCHLPLPLRHNLNANASLAARSIGF